MPLQKVLFKPGVNRENTRYTTEGGWYECDKIRFRQGTPEVIGGWQRISSATFFGVCRSLWNWVTLGGDNLIGIGTNLKFGLATEYSIQLIRSNWLSSISLYTKGDLSQLTVLNQNDVIFRDELVRVGLTLNLNKQMKKLDWNF